MRWCGSVLKRHSEVHPAIAACTLNHPLNGVTELASNLEKAVRKLGTVVMPWKRLKPICDCIKDIAEYCRKLQKEAAVAGTTSTKPTKSPKKKSAAAVSPSVDVGGTVLPIVRTTITLLGLHNAQLPGIKSLVQYHNNVMVSTFKLSTDAIITVPEKEKIDKPTSKSVDQSTAVEDQPKKKKVKKSRD